MPYLERTPGEKARDAEIVEGIKEMRHGGKVEYFCEPGQEPSMAAAADMMTHPVQVDITPATKEAKQ